MSAITFRSSSRIANTVYPINLGSELNGSYVSLPRQITLRLGYQFQPGAGGEALMSEEHHAPGFMPFREIRTPSAAADETRNNLKIQNPNEQPNIR